MYKQELTQVLKTQPKGWRELSVQCTTEGLIVLQLEDHWSVEV